ncbi:hypothetical protein L1887_01180 [Cichorium endivia]|nr:hypothetical protein L1887_01180 [Cichorium endivia]
MFLSYSADGEMCEVGVKEEECESLDWDEEEEIGRWIGNQEHVLRHFIKQVVCITYSHILVLPLGHLIPPINPSDSNLFLLPTGASIGCDDNGLNGEDVVPYSFLIAGKSKRFSKGIAIGRRIRLSLRRLRLLRRVLPFNGLNGEDVVAYSFLIAGKSKRFRFGFECVDGEYIPVDTGRLRKMMGRLTMRR